MNARAVPVRFGAAPSRKKPGIKAEAQPQAYDRQQRKQHHLRQPAVGLLTGLRLSLEQAGVSQKTLLVAGDGNFCNRALFRTPRDRIELLGRTRADRRLCRPAPPGSHRTDDQQKFTPEHVRPDEAVFWQSRKRWQGGKPRKLRDQEIQHVRWQSGAGPRRLRLLVVAPLPYRRTRHSRLCYRRSAYLLTTDRSTPAVQRLPV